MGPLKHRLYTEDLTWTTRELPFEPPSKLQLHAPQIAILIQAKRIVQNIHAYFVPNSRPFAQKIQVRQTVKLSTLPHNLA